MVDRQAETGEVWTLTAEAFDRLLAALDPDRERAGERYELARRKLVKFFEWRGCAEPDAFADEAINRVARRLAAGEQINDINSFFGGVARLLLLEGFKAQERRGRAHDRIARDRPASYDARADLEGPEDASRRLCFDSCLAGLPAAERELITGYYVEEGRAKIENRRALAARLDIPLNALRIRAHRIRARLEACVAECVRRRA